MLIVIGAVLIVMGLITVFFGDRKVGNQRGGWILQTASWPKGKARWLKTPMGVALIVAGLLVIFRGPPL